MARQNKPKQDPLAQKTSSPDPLTGDPAIAIRATQTTTAFTGPLPSPSVLKDYEAVHTGLAERIVVMAERQLEHRMAVENAAIETQRSFLAGETSGERRGQIWGGCICVLAILCGTYAAVHGAQWGGGLIGGGGLGALVTAFILGRRHVRQNPTDERHPIETDAETRKKAGRASSSPPAQ